LFFCLLWLATPRVYIHKLFDHKHEFFPNTGETSIQTEADPDCDFDKYDTPVYFTLFKFINKFIPLKPREEAFIIKNSARPDSQTVRNYPSRAPPVV
jgi:hypothetical protein